MNSKRPEKPKEELRTVPHLFKGRPYCQLSAAFATANKDVWLVPEDVTQGSFDSPTTPEWLCGYLEQTFHVSGLRLDESISDACLCAFAGAKGGAWLATWDVYSGEDILEIWTGLAQALLRRTISKILEARVEDGRILLHLEYQPVAGDPKDLADIKRSTKLLERLAAAHRSGLVHGGINQRWVSLSPHPNIFGFGLAALYAAWRRGHGIKLGLLSADPRFASPDELMGETASARSDQFSLAALITASHLTTHGLADKIPLRVQGGNSFLDRIARTEDWVRALEGSTGEKKAREKLAVAISTGLAPDRERRRRWMWQAAILVLAVVAGAIGERLVATRNSHPAGWQVAGPEVSPRETPTLTSPNPTAPGNSSGAVGAPTPPSAVIAPAAPTQVLPVATAAFGGLRAMSVDEALPDWLSKHGKELGDAARACGTQGITGLLLGGEIPGPQIVQFTGKLTQSLDTAIPGTKNLVKRIRPVPLGKPVFLVTCGVAQDKAATMASQRGKKKPT